MTMRIKPAEKPTHKRPQQESLSHKAFIKLLPCLTCGLPDHSDAHHIKPACDWAGKRHSGTQKPDDCWTVPLCRKCHNELHHHGDELAWWQAQFYGVIDQCAVAAFLWLASGDQERGEQIIRANQ